MSNDLHWDPATQRMQPGLALYKADIDAKIKYGEQCLARLQADGASSVALDTIREQIETWRALRTSLDAVPV